MLGNALDQFKEEGLVSIGLGLNHNDPKALIRQRRGKVGTKRCFPGSRRTGHQDVLAGVSGGNRERTLSTRKVAGGYDQLTSPRNLLSGWQMASATPRQPGNMRPAQRPGCEAQQLCGRELH